MMIEIDEIKKYIANELEIDQIEITEDLLVVDIIKIANVHEDDKKFFVLNFMDKYKIYKQERDINYNFNLKKFGYLKLLLHPVFYIVNILKYDRVDYSDLTVGDLHRMANSRKWDKN